MTRRTFLAAPALLQAAPRRPNVVMFMTDDHGAWASGFGGCPEIQTPNLNRLASGGMTFSRAYAATPVCSPSRMTWLTGTLPTTHGVQDWLRPEDSFGPKTRKWLAGRTSYSSVLAKAGYRCGMTGKWHMGEDDTAQEGFSYWATIPGGGGPYKDTTFTVNGKQVHKPGFKEDAIGDFAVEFLNQAAKGDQPFYLLMPFYAPHTPFSYQPEQDRAPYANSPFSCFPDEDRHPWQNRGLSNNWRNPDSKRAYSALITGMDRNVGRVLQRLDELGVRGDTTIVFTADQGWNAGHHGFWGKGNGTWPFNMYEESIRVPLIWNHPGRIKSGQQQNMVSSYDYFPTVLDWCGVSAAADAKRIGQSYAAALRGQRPPRRDRLYFEYAMARGVRTETMKYIARSKEWPSEMYDLEKDPGEKRNVVDDAAYGKQRAALAADLERFYQGLGAAPLDQWRSMKQIFTDYPRFADPPAR
jgi:arylsulfatase A-like enzyme